jgi:hypothetical protein
MVNIRGRAGIERVGLTSEHPCYSEGGESRVNPRSRVGMERVG